jgi:hypothetical protein
MEIGMILISVGYCNFNGPLAQLAEQLTLNQN